MLDRRLIIHFDFGILFLTLLFSLIGVGAIYSASHTASGGSAALALKQLSWIGLGLLALVATISIHYQTLQRYAYLLYYGALLLLVLVDVTGRVGMGARRWIQLGPVSLQPAEIAKITLILAMARYIADVRERGGFTLGRSLNLTLLIGLPVALIVRQPDLGTAMMLLVVALALVFISGIPVRPLLYAGLGALAAAPLLWRFLKPYQQQRILVFLKPDLDPSGSGYHIIQSKIAIGSGGLLGKGILQGTQSQLRFLPEQHTDFIFSVIAEETGFVGAALLLLLFSYFIYKGIEVALKAHDLFGTLVVAGVTCMIAFYIFVNIGMTAGLFPVVGIPLPFISYGGSALITLYIATGLILNVRMRRFQGD